MHRCVSYFHNMKNDFNQNRQRIKDIKDLLEISKNPESYKEFQLKSRKKN